MPAKRNHPQIKTWLSDASAIAVPYFGCAGLSGSRETYQTGIVVFRWSANTGSTCPHPVGKTAGEQNDYDLNRQFIALEKSFQQQLDNDPDFFPGESHYVLKEKMKLSANAMLAYVPDKLSLQLTEQSVFYTLIKDVNTIYLEHCLADCLDGRDEALVSVHRNGVNEINFSGSLTEAIAQINEFLTPQYNAIPEFA